MNYKVFKNFLMAISNEDLLKFYNWAQKENEKLQSGMENKISLFAKEYHTGLPKVIEQFISYFKNEEDNAIAEEAFHRHYFFLFVLDEIAKDYETNSKFLEIYKSDISKKLADLFDLIDNYKSNFSEDLKKTLEEIIIVYENNCYVSVLSLCGKTIEICLKDILHKNNIYYDQRWGIGKLIGECKSNIQNIYIDTASLKETCNIINNNRIPAVHAKEKVPVPSKEQAEMVINATVDILNRTLAND